MKPLALALLALVTLTACGDDPEASSEEGGAREDAPIEGPPAPSEGPEVPRDAPGVVGSDRPAEWWSLPGDGVCYAFERYVVRAVPRQGAVGEEVVVFRRSGGARGLCDDPASGAVYAVGPDGAEHFFGLIGDHLLLDEGTGPDGRTLRIVDLVGARVLHEAGYAEPIQVEDGALLYGMEPAVAETMEELDDLGVECPEAPVWLSEGLGVGVSPRVRYVFAERTAEPTGEVVCVPIQ
jgi:hypothetical protein